MLFSPTTSGLNHWIASHTATDQQMDWAMVLYPVGREESHDQMEGMYTTLTEIHLHVHVLYWVISYLLCTMDTSQHPGSQGSTVPDKCC